MGRLRRLCGDPTDQAIVREGKEALMVEILSPVWPAAGGGRPRKQRPQSLRGATIALVDDNLDIPFTTHLETLLAERQGASVKRLVKPSGTAPSPASLIDEAAGASAAIVGIGL
jgi:hypothetical protein